MASALTVSVDEALLARVDALARASDMSRDAVVVAALSGLVMSADANDLPPLQDWQAEKILKGMADLDRGAIVTDDEIDRIVRSFD